MNNDVEITLGDPSSWLGKYRLCTVDGGVVIVTIGEDFGVGALLIEDNEHNKSCVNALAAKGVPCESMKHIMQDNKKRIDEEHRKLPILNLDTNLALEEKMALISDWKWIVALGLSENNEKCTEDLCINIRVRHGVCCKRHHYELIKKRPFPFIENSLTNR